MGSYIKNTDQFYETPANIVEGVTTQVDGLNSINQKLLDNTNYLKNKSDNEFNVGSYDFSTNGYQILPSGLILQWGLDESTTSTGTVTFPIPFTTACFSVTATPTVNIGLDDNFSYLVTSVSTTGFEYHYNESRFPRWIAIGY